MQAKDVLACANSFIGCKESNGSHKKIIDIYNAHTPLARGYKVKYTDSWCATFVSAVAIKCGATDIIPTECGCEKMVTLFKNLGRWEESENHIPSAGDIIFYDWDKTDTWADHVGIVEKIDNLTLTVIEGNYNDAVGKRTIQIGDKRIRGYGKPAYSKPSIDYESLYRQLQNDYSRANDEIKRLKGLIEKAYQESR